MSTTTIVKHLSENDYRNAAKIARRLEARYQEYLDDCQEEYRQGYRPSSCEHGTNQWTDYDNICGPCEDGITMRDGVQRRRLALDRARQFNAETLKVSQKVSELSALINSNDDRSALWSILMRECTDIARRHGLDIDYTKAG